MERSTAACEMRWFVRSWPVERVTSPPAPAGRVEANTLPRPEPGLLAQTAVPRLLSSSPAPTMVRASVPGRDSILPRVLAVSVEPHDDVRRVPLWRSTRVSPAGDTATPTFPLVPSACEGL